MTTKILSYRISALWTTHWTTIKKKQENVQKEDMAASEWHFIYWEENPNFTNDDSKVLHRKA